MKFLVLASCFLLSTVAHAEFRPISIADSKLVYQQANAIFLAEKDKCIDQRADWVDGAADNPVCAYPVFLQMLAGSWIQAHKGEALEKAAKKHQPQASWEDIWELPYANDWLGCMSYQFKNADIFSQSNFQTFLKEPFLGGWIEKNSTADPEFLATLKDLTEIANKCEAIVRDQPPEGSISV